MLGSLIDSAWDNLEHSKGTSGDQASRGHIIPGWNDLVKPYQGEARFWFNLWISAGKPIHSATPGVEHDLFKNMKYSRNNYHYAVRRAQNEIRKIENDKLFAKMGKPEMFEEIKKSCRDLNSEPSSVIDDVHGAQKISNHFRDLYEQLYNEQEGISEDIVSDISNDVQNKSQESSHDISLFNGDLVKEAIKKLKTDKSDVSGDFTSDCLKGAPFAIHEHLAALFRTFLLHGYIS